MTQDPSPPEAEFEGPIRLRGDQLDLARRSAGWSQAELARRAGISEGHISRVINGHGGVTLETLALLLDAFGNRLHIREIAETKPGSAAGELTEIRGSGRATV
jgi:transcriptional regulator with XRE-family HTH domain